ncbi:hypothetical protein H8K15_16055 [Clostridium perfringens]|uniref:hypothetical protein n=1 Tax=Clostridium perfringens TaxID=1502 RepID=UPI0018E49520|nr:hypothetical protein [Clostridium perfringens]MBI6069522.1 hypothetical protein [Clostridium perfringens]MBI6097638.1 hypothetical protein [Clostridium perfringens]HAT4340897.1 hypothetical protein [Clostridium perfringens]HAT4347181.1 hypothetical protein [Clostridium perfringens]
MNKKIIFKVISIIVLIIVSIKIINIVYNRTNLLDEKTEIYEIPNTMDYAIRSFDNENVLVVDEYYLITNPPKDPKKLKEIVENFVEKNNIRQKLIDNGNRLNENKNIDSIQYGINFLKQSFNTPKNWQPKKGIILNDDTIDKHKDDLIAYYKFNNYNNENLYFAF